MKFGTSYIRAIYGIPGRAPAVVYSSILSINQGLITPKESYWKSNLDIYWNPRMIYIFVWSFLNLVGTSAVILQRCLPNLKKIAQIISLTKFIFCTCEIWSVYILPSEMLPAILEVRSAGSIPSYWPWALIYWEKWKSVIFTALMGDKYDC